MEKNSDSFNNKDFCLKNFISSENVYDFSINKFIEDISHLKSGDEEENKNPNNMCLNKVEIEENLNKTNMFFKRKLKFSQRIIDKNRRYSGLVYIIY